MLVRNRAGRFQDTLIGLPPAGCVDETLVLHFGPVTQIHRLWFSQPAIRQETTRQRAIGEKLGSGLLTEVGKCTRRAAINQRKRDLIGQDRHTIRMRDAQMRGVEICNSDLGDQPLVAKLRQNVKRIEPCGVLKAPPVKLKKVHAIHAQPVQSLLNTGADDVARHLTRRRAPFGEHAYRPVDVPDQKATGDDLGTTVMVGHVERVEPLPCILLKPVRPSLGIDDVPFFLDIGDLPKASQNTRDIERLG